MLLYFLEISTDEDSQSVLTMHSQPNKCDGPNHRFETLNNGKIDQDSELNVRPRKKKRTWIVMSDSESQGAELDVSQDAEKRSAYEYSGKYIYNS